VEDRATADEYFDSAREGRRPFSDFGWFAIDTDHCLAILTAAGSAAIPMAAFADEGDFRALDAHFLNGPPVTEAIIVHATEGDLSHWTRYAEQGLFAYDWCHAVGQYAPRLPYKLVARPAVPATRAALPAKLQQAVDTVGVRMPFRFTDTTDIVVEDLFDRLNL
jgi:hypothetical protein